MADYIDREELLTHQYNASRSNWPQMAEMVVSVKDIEDVPAVDVTPVVHGRWEWLGPNRLVTNCMCGTCSACKVRSKYIVNTMLCPNCGAKMDGGDGDAVD